MTERPDPAAAISGWRPEPVEVTGRLDPWPVAATDAALLFRVSALTYNNHRIH
jgi:hydroxyacyl-ACP dehydratase HTD2-like protein with hotdog domain